MLRCDLANLLRQAAAAIPAHKDRSAYAFGLGEVAGHIQALREGRATLEEFADFYMLRPLAPAADREKR